MSLSREQLQADLRTKLEKLLREQRAVEADKKMTVDAFNEDLKRIGNAISAVLDEIETCQAPLFDHDGKPAITLAQPEKHEAEL
jgi:hypothetical protein